jgi:hypothetical protein
LTKFHTKKNAVHLSKNKVRVFFPIVANSLAAHLFEKMRHKKRIYSNMLFNLQRRRYQPSKDHPSRKKNGARISSWCTTAKGLISVPIFVYNFRQ